MVSASSTRIFRDDGDVRGDAGTVIHDVSGPLNLGTGDIHINTTVVSGDGATVVQGDNPAGISMPFTHDAKSKKRKKK
ncbi:hypothetical protein [Nonomuraea sp. NPDC049684]|uniref:hypothetical protein n=1 Tax=unclassified Nonomuraea TaxID=2593643 RepID=UPI0037BB5084